MELPNAQKFKTETSSSDDYTDGNEFKQALKCYTKGIGTNYDELPIIPANLLELVGEYQDPARNGSHECMPTSSLTCATQAGWQEIPK